MGISERSTLVVRLHANDEGALQEMMEAHFDQVAAFAMRYVHSRETAREIAQDTFFRCWEQRHRLTPETVLIAYLLRIARNRALDIVRRAAVDQRLERHVANETLVGERHADNAGVAHLERDEFHAIVLDVAATLTPRVREVFLMYFEQQLTPVEIATVLDVTPKTVYKQLTSALQVYMQKLQGLWP